jgi:hypothetical protein
MGIYFIRQVDVRAKPEGMWHGARHSECWHSPQFLLFPGHFAWVLTTTTGEGLQSTVEGKVTQSRSGFWLKQLQACVLSLPHPTSGIKGKSQTSPLEMWYDLTVVKIVTGTERTHGECLHRSHWTATAMTTLVSRELSVMHLPHEFPRKGLCLMVRASFWALRTYKEPIPVTHTEKDSCQSRTIYYGPGIL